jgi:bla regulator protein BlaR1
MIAALENHLWQSTLFACVVALLTLMLRKNRAAVRHWLWLAASVKFLVPFSILVGIVGQVEWRKTPAAAPPQFSVVEQITSPLHRGLRHRWWFRYQLHRAGFQPLCSVCGCAG